MLYYFFSDAQKLPYWLFQRVSLMNTFVSDHGERNPARRRRRNEPRRTETTPRAARERRIDREKKRSVQARCSGRTRDGDPPEI